MSNHLLNTLFSVECLTYEMKNCNEQRKNMELCQLNTFLGIEEKTAQISQNPIR
jgi:hypothetical protein